MIGRGVPAAAPSARPRGLGQIKGHATRPEADSASMKREESGLRLAGGGWVACPPALW